MKNYRHSLMLCMLLLVKDVLYAQKNLILNGHNESVNVVAFTNDSSTLISGSKDGVLISWAVAEDFKKKNMVETGDAAVTSLAISHSGKEFVAGTYRVINRYNVATFKKLDSEKKAHTTFVESLNYSSDDKMIVSSSWKENALMLWDADGLKKIKQFQETVWTDEAIFSPDNKYVITCNHFDVAKVWDVSTGNIVNTFAGHEDWIYAVEITADQKKLITGSLDKTIRTWDFQSGKSIQSFTGHTDGVYLLALSGDDSLLASAAMDVTIRLWDMKKNAEISLIKLPSRALGITFSPDNKYLVAGLEDHSILVWEVNEILTSN